MSDSNEAGAKQLWQSQPSEIPPMSTAYLQHRARELERAVRIRDFIEQGSCVLTLLACAVMIFTVPDHWLRAAMVLVFIGVAYALLQWRRRIRGYARNGTADTGLAFYVRELEHKRDLHRTMWRWYLLPIVPGTLALMTWNFFGDPDSRGTATPWIFMALALAWVIGALIYERFKAAQYQREIDALTAKDSEPSARIKG